MMAMMGHSPKVCREARVKGTNLWFNMGNMTHCEAAAALGMKLKLEDQRTVETREKGGDIIWEHLVTPEVIWDVVPLRNDEHTDEP